MSKIGTKVLLKIGGDLLIGQNSLSYKENITMIETSSKTTGAWSEFAAGRGAFTMAVGGIASTSPEATEAGFAELKAASDARVPIECVFGEFSDEAGTTVVSGSMEMTIQCLVSGLSWESPDNDKNTFSCDLQGTGAPAYAVVGA
jgi:predicted secreted protein